MSYFIDSVKKVVDYSKGYYDSGEGFYVVFTELDSHLAITMFRELPSGCNEVIQPEGSIIIDIKELGSNYRLQEVDYYLEKNDPNRRSHAARIIWNMTV